MPSSSRIIADYRAKVAEPRRRGDNAHLFRTLLADLRGQGLHFSADSLERKIAEADRADRDPAAEPVILKLYRSADGSLADRHGMRRRRAPSPSVEADRRRELWETFSRAASTLASAPMRCRLVMVTLTVTSRMPWSARLATIEARRAQVRKVVGRHALWYAEARDVQGPRSGHSPHLHLLYVLEEQACRPVATAIRGLHFRTHVRSYDHLDGDRRKAVLTDRMRRRRWLEALAYVMKVSGECGRYKFLPPVWDVEFESMRPGFHEDDGSHAIAVKAMYAHYAKGRRIFRIASKMEPKGTIPRTPSRSSAAGDRAGTPEATSEMPRRGRRRIEIGEAELALICTDHATMTERAAAAGMSEKTLRKRMNELGMATPRGTGRVTRSANGKNVATWEELVLL